jgi:predicted transposase YdaD
VSKPFDVTTKALIETSPHDWLTLLGLGPEGDVRVIDADIATVTAAADKILRVEATPPWLLHLELQAGHDADLASRVHVYNALLHYRHRLPVRSVVVLLRPEADRASLTGRLHRSFSGEEPYETFHYRIVRTWELPVETVLQGV